MDQIRLNKNIAMCMYVAMCTWKRIPGESLVNAVDYVGKSFFPHLLKLLLQMVFGDLVSYNWTLPRGEQVGENLKQIYVAVFCGQ